MSDEASNNSMIPPEWPRPSEVNVPPPQPTEVVDESGCKPLAPDSPVRPNTKQFNPPPPKPPVIA